MTELDYKNAFIMKHAKADWRVETSPMDEYGRYHKTYIFTDGAVLYEINTPITVTAEAETVVKGITVKITQDVELLETECWNTDNSHSVKFYERF